jgi:transposase
LVRGTFAWLNQLRRLRVRYDKRADIREAFLCGVTRQSSRLQYRPAL